MKYISVQNPTWNKERTVINCVVVFESLGSVPFSAVPEDQYAHTVEIYNRCVAGEFGPVADYASAPDEGPQPISEPAQSNQPMVEGAQTL